MTTERQARNARFQRGSAVYECGCCGKKTRETGSCESGCDLCLMCFDWAGEENAHSDNGHEGSPPEADCVICQNPGIGCAHELKAEADQGVK